MIGRVIKFHNGFFFVECDGEIVPCSLRGILKRYKKQTPVCAGDFVEIDTNAVIKRVINRSNLIPKPNAANVDQIIVTVAAKEPDIHPLLLNRFLVLAEAAAVKNITICVNKIDLIDNADNFLRDYETLYKIFRVSARNAIGIENLRDALADKVTLFTGPSGVGKSSIMNALDPAINQTVGAISDKIRRGKNTTRVAELIKFAGGYLIDTPGFSAVELADLGVNEKNLAHHFPEFHQHSQHCRFNPCSHSHEPDCAVKSAVERGAILQQRYDAYVALLKELYERKSKYD